MEIFALVAVAVIAICAPAPAHDPAGGMGRRNCPRCGGGFLDGAGVVCATCGRGSAEARVHLEIRAMCDDIRVTLAKLRAACGLPPDPNLVPWARHPGNPDNPNGGAK